MNTLVADDDEWVSKRFAAVLKSDGHQFEPALDGREALAKLRPGCFDLLILDVMMPYMNGFEVLRYLRIEPMPRPVPVLMLLPPMALVKQMQAALRQEGAHVCFMKHRWDPPLVRAAVRAAIDEHESELGARDASPDDG
jgi:CheY-like chemotaxis protein